MRPMLIAALLALVPTVALCQGEVISADFDDGRFDPEAFGTIPSRDTPVQFAPHGDGKAIHLRGDGRNVGIGTRKSFPSSFTLSFEFCQPADEAGGYRAVVAHSADQGQSFWFEYDKTALAVWTDYEDGWAPRWEAGGLAPDTWYTVTVQNELERVHFSIRDASGAVVAESPWLPHDVVGLGSVSFRADSGDTLRGVLFDSIRLQLPSDQQLAGLVPGVEKALHQAMGAGGPAPSTPTRVLQTGDGLRLRLDQAGVVRGWEIDGKRLAAPRAGAIGGLWAWDVAAGRQYHRFVPRPVSGDGLSLSCAELHLELQAEVTAREDRLDFHATLRDTTGEDRAIVLVWALPLDGEGLAWGDDLLRSRTIGAEGRYHSALKYPESGKFGSHLVSPYPWASLTGPDAGVMVSRPLDEPRLMGMYYDHTQSARFLAVRAELGLSPITAKFPSSADFRFSLSRVPRPEWGFRAATQRYYSLYPQSFTKRVEREGIWHLWVSTEVPEPEDFGLVFHEQEPYYEDRVAFDDAHGGYSLTYSEQNALWQHTKAYGTDGRFAPQAFMDEVSQRARQPMDVRVDYPFWSQPNKVPDAEIAQALQHSYMGSEGNPSILPAPPDRVAVNCNGDPELPKPNRASLWFDYEGVPALTDPKVDGAYMDSLGWGAFDKGENHRREQWATADIPLVPSFREGRPCQLGVFAHRELFSAVADAMHERGKLTIANTFPYAHCFTADLLDVMGVGETNDLSLFHSPGTLSYCRALAYHKPISHMNYGYLLPTVAVEDKERAIQKNLVFGVWPGTGNGGNLEHLEAVRALYRKYIPTLRAMANAGWEPITMARAEPQTAIVERYGQPGGEIYIAVHNPTDQAVTVRVKLEAELGITSGRATDLVTGGSVMVEDGVLEVWLEPWTTAVVAA